MRASADRRTVPKPWRRSRWIAILVAVAVAVAVMFAACGGGNDSGAGSGEAEGPAPEPGPSVDVARAFLKGLASLGGEEQDSLWDLTSSEVKEACDRATFDRTIDQLRFRGSSDVDDYFALAGGVPALVEVAKGDDWLVVDAPQIDIRLAVVREGEDWRVHPDLSSTYCFDAPPLPAVVEDAGVDLSGG